MENDMANQALVVRENGAVEKRLTADKTKAIWASAGADVKSPEVARALALIGERYELDPALGEVLILGGKVYIGFEGYLRIAEQNPAYDGYELRPMSEQDRQDAKVGINEFAYVCHVWRKDRRFPSVGFGVASDATISMGPMKLFAREVAEKRAFHRALKMAFRAGIPDYDDAIELIAQGQTVAVEQLAPPADVAPAPASPNWAAFWQVCKGLGASRDEVHEVLGVGSVLEWPGSLDEAITKVEQFILTRDRTPAEAPVDDVAAGNFEEVFPRHETVTPPAKPTPPPVMPTQTGKTSERRAIPRSELEAKYRSLVDRADTLGVPAKMHDPAWSEQVLIDEGMALRLHCNLSEEKQAKQV